MPANRSQVSETQRKRLLKQRMIIVYGILLVCTLIIVARLLELQVIRGSQYRQLAQDQHFRGVTLPAKRGEVLSSSSKTSQTSILATNTTLDLVYVDPYLEQNSTLVAETLADILVNEDFHSLCSQGDQGCPRELVEFYPANFDPLEKIPYLNTGSLLEPLPQELPTIISENTVDIVEVRRQFARDIEERIKQKRVTFVPLKYGANKVEIQTVSAMNIAGVYTSDEAKLVYANPEVIVQSQVPSIARRLADPLELDQEVIRRSLRSRPLRYVPIMRRLPPILSSQIREVQERSAIATLEKKKQALSSQQASGIIDPLWSIALLPEHWRVYPDSTVGSHIVGFINNNGDPQYGVERTFDPQLRGQEGLIRTVNDPTGGKILTAEQRIVDPEDGDTVVLTIDRTIQKEVEKILNNAIEEYQADSAQVIIMDPPTGRIIAMVNAPLFDANNYGGVYTQIPIYLDENKQKEVVVELYHPQTREFIVKAYYGDIFTNDGFNALSQETQESINYLKQLYELEDIVRYYLYIGENSRREIFPTQRSDVWLKYANNIGVGAYLNRNIQEIYEPGSVMKPVTMAIAIDQGEVTPSDRYFDDGPVEVDEFTIKNAFNRYFDDVNMTDCLAFSINTCMTFVSEKLGRKLFHRKLHAFGFGKITGIELEDELPGEILPWRKWSNALTATAAYGQGISATPLQMITAFSALANGGRLMRPTIIDEVRKSSGIVEKNKPHLVDQVITPETSDTITSMLVSSVNNGYAKSAGIPGYRIAGKTGTSQIAGPGGRYETGTGSSITSFVGFAPIRQPKFAILVKIDRPRTLEYGSVTAAPVFRDIVLFLINYYGLPPDEQ